jgi:hypothetical protein
MIGKWSFTREEAEAKQTKATTSRIRLTGVIVVTYLHIANSGQREE